MNLSTAQRLALSFGNGWDFSQYSRKTFLTDVRIEANKWYFITAVIHNVYDIRIFINGQDQYGFVEGIADELVYAGEQGNIGKKDANYLIEPFYFKGYMDEFKYWNRGLSNEEVRALYEEETLLVDQSVYKKRIKVYPNPTTDYLNISTNIKETYTVELTDQFGKVCYSSDDKDKVINMAGYPNGLYLIHLITEKGDHIFQKVIKQ